MPKKNSCSLETRVIHAGQTPDPVTGAIMPPIYATSTYVQTRPGEHKGFEYSRTQNPTRFAYERCIADLENGKHGFAFASGMAAISTVLELLNPGDHVISLDDVYGGTYRLFEKVRRYSANLNFSFVDATDVNNIEAAILPNTKMIWLESPSNPLMRLADIKACAKIAKQHGVLLVVDNTFATPMAQQPLSLGADIVIHSATKYISGHSDLINGIVVVGDRPELAEKLAFLQNSVGAIADPFSSFLALRGVKTLAIRMERHTENALFLAKWLATHSQIETIYYPGLSTFPQHALAKQQMRLFGGMLSIKIKGDLKKTFRFCEALRIFNLAESLGGVESLVNHPATMTHASIPKEIREKRGMTDNLIRLSVGIEAKEDLLADLEQGLAKKRRKK